MRNLTLLSLMVLWSALNCGATEPLQLGGDGGRVILMQIASVNLTSQITNASQGDLWNWGKIPMNYAISRSGKIFETTSADEDNIWLGAISSSMPLNMSEYE